jgi:hypothetical protein
MPTKNQVIVVEDKVNPEFVNLSEEEFIEIMRKVYYKQTKQ